MELFERNVNKIFLACFVGKGSGTPVHVKRAYHGIVFCTSGETDYRFEGGKCFRCTENDVLYLPKGSSYTVGITPESSCFCINFDLIEDGDIRSFLMKMRNFGKVRELFKSAEAVWKKKAPGFECKCKSLLYAVFYEICAEANNGYISSKSFKLIQPALEQIHSHYFDGRTDIPYLAELCGISQTYFRTTFFKRLGTSPVKYINRLKLERARELIESGGYGVKDAALLSGFTDESYFSREFKRYFGFSPILAKKQPSRY